MCLRIGWRLLSRSYLTRAAYLSSAPCVSHPSLAMPSGLPSTANLAMHIFLMAMATWQWLSSREQVEGLLGPRLGYGTLSLPSHSIGPNHMAKLKVKGLEYRPHFFCVRWCKINIPKSINSGWNGKLEKIMQSTTFTSFQYSKHS